jgi:uncharacterized cupredoxin-like copper-binding protein
VKRTLILSTFALAAFFFSACSGSAPPVEFTVEMTEFVYTPDTFEVRVGQEVTFHLINNGALEHEFMVGQNVAMMDGMPGGYEHNMFEGEEPMVVGAGAGHQMEGMEDADHGFMVAVPKGGEETTLTFTVTEDMVGEWEVGCFTDGGSHYNQGMHGTLTVLP